MTNREYRSLHPISSIVESISFDRRRNLVEENELKEEVEDAVKKLSIAAIKQPELAITEETEKV